MNPDFFNRPVPQSTYRQRRAKPVGNGSTPEQALQPLPPDANVPALKQRIQDQFDFIYQVMMPRFPINPQTKSAVLNDIYHDLGLPSDD
ncbi:hypothetical protein EBZ35_01270 [bacterium]|nr:hypothetical protein [bacterium]